MLSFAASWFGRNSNSSTAATEATQALLSSLLTMAWFVEARDPYTGGHLWRVSRYAHLLATAAGLSAPEAARISLGGFLHDLGKIGIADAILRKTSALTDDEYAVVKTHPEQGLRMLAGHPLASLVREAIYSHHERPDGKGYPRGLSGSELHIDARIVGLCDAFDAMTSSRPYRAGMSRGQALAIIQGQSGSQFDPQLSERFLELGRQGVLDHVMGHSDDGIPLQSCPMCGPTLVLTRESHAGEHIYCRNCAGEFELRATENKLVAEPTGRQGSPHDLEPEADHGLIRRAVAEAAANMPLEQMLRTTQQGG
ncbi:HD domain-containing protein [Pseudomonas aeruginosa]|nr:HD domain-containing protein [Pseudomonas aeruginosa]RUJ42944.1 HD domain-containing protein [Pseudomonas aeruginosa]